MIDIIKKYGIVSWHFFFEMPRPRMVNINVIRSNKSHGVGYFVVYVLANLLPFSRGLFSTRESETSQKSFNQQIMYLSRSIKLMIHSYLLIC